MRVQDQCAKDIPQVAVISGCSPRHGSSEKNVERDHVPVFPLARVESAGSNVKYEIGL